MGYDSRCRICSDVAARDLVAGALASGLRPAEILRRYPERFGQSSLYRHCRGHLASSPLVPSYLDGDTTITEAAGDLGRVRRDLLALFDRAVSRGADASAARLAREVATVTGTLKSRFDIDHDETHDEDVDALMDGIQHAARTRTDFARELAVSLRAEGHDRLASHAAGLADYYDQHAAPEQRQDDGESSSRARAMDAAMQERRAARKHPNIDD